MNTSLPRHGVRSFPVSRTRGGLAHLGAALLALPFALTCATACGTGESDPGAPGPSARAQGAGGMDAQGSRGGDLPDIPDQARRRLPVHRLKKQTGESEANHVPGTPPAGGALTYHGGKVVSKVAVIDVYWGSNIDSGIRSRQADEMKAMVSPTYMGWLDAEYNTFVSGGTNQHINPGSWYGSWTIAPHNTATDLCNGDVQDELRYQASHYGIPLPADENTAYMVHFPPGVTIHGNCFLWSRTETTCVDNCGWHDHTSVNGVDVPYAVLPDLSTQGCLCDSNPTNPDHVSDAFLVESHELIELVTDPYPRSGWADTDGNEISDVCAWIPGTVPGTGATTGTPVVQTQWSNAFNKCIPFAFASTANDIKVVPGTSTTFQLKRGDTADAYNFSLSNMNPISGVTLTFNPSSFPTATDPTVTVTAAANAPLTAKASITASASDPSASPSFVNSIPLSVSVTCPSGTSYCNLQNACVAGACTCAAGLQLCTATNTCVSNASDPAQCPQPIDCSSCECGCNSAGTACQGTVSCNNMACTKAGGFCDPCFGCVQ